MSKHFLFRSVAGIAGVALAATLATPAAARPSPAQLNVPRTVAATGDSITVAYDATSLGAQPQYSWATGTVASVKSVAARLKLVYPGLTSANVAVTGARMADLNTQATRVALGTDLVTVLMGANDACGATLTAMTPVDTFRAQLRSALGTLSSRGVDQVVVASIPDIYQLWSLAKGSGSARTVWSLFRVCQSMLANPSSSASADEDRRRAVRQRVIDYNTVLAQECAALAAASPVTACRYDGGAVFATTLKLSDISTVDYFHPSPAGQAKLADRLFTAAQFSATAVQPA